VSAVPVVASTLPLKPAENMRPTGSVSMFTASKSGEPLDTYGHTRTSSSRLPPVYAKGWSNQI
jgi:hypothetical protein